MVYLLGIHKVTTTVSPKGVLQIGIRPAYRKVPFDTQRVTTLAFSSFWAKRPETRFYRETWTQ